MATAVVLGKLAELGQFAKSASSMVPDETAARVRTSFGRSPNLPTASPSRQSSWRAGAVKASTHPDTLTHISRLIQLFPAARDHQEALSALGSQIVFAQTLRTAGFEDCGLALIRFSGAIESAFGFTREVTFFYSPHQDLQIRTFKAAKQALSDLSREVTPDVIFFWAPDVRLREKLDDWSSGKFLAVPLEISDEDPVAFVSLLRDYVYSRDLFYETTPVRGDRFFGRRKLLQGLGDDVKNQRVTGLFGLRKSGKTSVLTELGENLSDDRTLIILRDLESLPSPPIDPIPDLLRDLVGDLLGQLRLRNLRTRELADLGAGYSIPEFKRAMQVILRKLATDDIGIIIMLDEIEYLTPSDRIDIHEGNMASVAQLLGCLRSLVQENANFTFLISGLTSAIVESGRLYGRPNPLFSWAKANFLAPFNRAEADELAKTVGRKMGIEIEEGALDALFEASGGHAFLYRHLASNVVQGLPINVYQRKMRRADVLQSLHSWRRLIAGNMQEMLDHVRRYYPDEAFLLDVLRNEPESFGDISDAAPLALGHLVSLGLVQEADSGFELSPVLYLL